MQKYNFKELVKEKFIYRTKITRDGTEYSSTRLDLEYLSIDFGTQVLGMNFQKPYFWLY